MGRELGRISGPLLADNLLRNGKNLAFDSKLLYLDVVNKRIGVGLSVPTRELIVKGTIDTTNLLVDNLVSVTQNIELSGNTIHDVLGSLVLSASDYVFADNVRTHTIDIRDNVISTINNGTLQLRPNGAGSLLVYADTNVTGNLHATGNITADGDIIFGSDSSDSVIFNADIATDIIPNQTGTYTLGNETTTWLDLYTKDLHSGNIVASSVVSANNLNPILTQGKAYYVASNGSDTNHGDHENAPYATIAKALSVAVSGDKIHIYPGTYTEVFPLTVPTGVTVNGVSLRSVTIQPTTGTNHNDAFLVNGETTVSNVTVSGFFYDSVNDTGYGFRFAPGAKTTTRSPYVQNCSVITKGSVVNANDPLGFDAGDAGKGALVDGSVCDATTYEAALLFHSVTFITPGVDALTMTNGVRVEWLNSFTYFANRSLYATNGSLGLASLGIKFGAEIRSIASASVYGNYGAYADGANTLMYLIQYNFGYIGAGKDSSNDLTLVNQVREVTELNSGKIYYQSVDQQGTFRVGKEFYADFTTGVTSIDVSSGNITGLSSLSVVSGTDVTYIDASKISTGNIVLEGNVIRTTSGDFNIVSASTDINLTQNALIDKNLSVVGDAIIDGILTIGNQTVDTVSFNADAVSDILPNAAHLHTIGSDANRWLHLYANRAYLNGITISDNVVTTSTLNTDLSLEASSTYKIIVPSNDVQFDQNLTVNGSTATTNVVVIGGINQTGNYVQTGAVSRIGDTEITGHLTTTSTVNFSGVQIGSNIITSTVTNTDLKLIADGTGKIYVPLNNVQLDKNLTVTGTAYLVNVSMPTSTATANVFTTGDAYLSSNYLTTTGTNHDLELRANGTGKILVPSNNVEVVNNLTANGETHTKNVGIVGSLGLTGTYLLTGASGRTGNTNITGSLSTTSYAQYQDIKINSNVVTTTVTNSDFKLEANGTGKVIVPNNNVEITNNLTVSGATGLNLINVTNTVTAPGFDTSDILITSNYITTQGTNHNLELRASGTNKVLVPLKNVEITNNLAVNGTTSLKATNIGAVSSPKLLTHVGDTLLTGADSTTGSLVLSGTLTAHANGLFPGVTVIDKRISGTALNTDLLFKAATTGRIYAPSNAVRIDQKLTVIGTTSAADITSTGTIVANTFTDGDIVITSNTIGTTLSNNNLAFSANGSGQVALEKIFIRDNIISTQTNNDNIVITPSATKNLLVTSPTAFKIPSGTAAQRTMLLAGEMRFSTTDNVFSAFSTARRTLGGVYSADRLTRAVAHPTNNSISFTANSVDTMDLLTDRIRMNGLLIDNETLLNGNVISNSTLNQEFFLSPSSGKTTINLISVIDNEIINETDSPITIAHTGAGYLKFTGTDGIAIPSGTEAEKPLPSESELGKLRWNTELAYEEIFDGTQWIPITGTLDVATASEIVEIGDLWSLILG